MYHSSQLSNMYSFCYTSCGTLDGTRLAQWVHYEGSIRRVLAPWTDCLPQSIATTNNCECDKILTRCSMCLVLSRLHRSAVPARQVCMCTCQAPAFLQLVTFIMLLEISGWGYRALFGSCIVRVSIKAYYLSKLPYYYLSYLDWVFYGYVSRKWSFETL